MNQTYFPMLTRELINSLYFKKKYNGMILADYSVKAGVQTTQIQSNSLRFAASNCE